MMRSLVRSAVLLLVFATTGFSQISFDFTGAGSRARAMGGAFIGVSDDVTAATWNPAGLWVHEGPKFGAGYGTFLPRGEAEGNLSVADQSGSWNKFHTLNFLAPVRIRGQQFVGSVSYSRIFEDYQSLSANLNGTYLRPGGGTAAFSETLTSESHFEPRSLTFALGTRVSEKISIGASADIYLGKAVSETRQNITWQDYPDFDSPQTAVRSQDVLVLDTTTFSGFGLTGGIMYNADQFNIGLLVRAPFSFEATTDQKFFTLTSYAGLAQPDQSDTTFIDNQLVKYDLPIMFALGLSYNLTENLMWAFDAEYRGFEGRDAERRTEINISEDTETFESVDLQWQNVFTFRSGLEFMWETGSSAFPLVPLRAGFAYVPIPTPNAALNPNATSEDDLFDYSSTSGYNITAGFGLWWELVTIDIAYVYGSLDRESVVQLGTDMSNIEFIPVETRNRTHDLTLTFTGYF